MNAHQTGWSGNLLACLLVVVTSSGASGQTITTVAGRGLDDEGPATRAGLAFPRGAFVDGAGNLYIADAGHHRILRVDAVTGISTTVAGTGEFGFSGDGGPATRARLFWPGEVVVDRSGHLYIADADNLRIRRVDASTGVVTTVAGTGESGYSGDGGPATEANITGPSGISVDGAGHLYIRSGTRVRRIDAATGIITTVAGAGADGNFPGDGGPATEADLSSAGGVFVDGAGNLYIADSFNNRIRRVDGETGVITTVAGSRNSGFSGDGGPATEAGLPGPQAVVVDDDGNLYIACSRFSHHGDAFDNRVRKVDGATGIITTVAGIGNEGLAGDGGPAAEALLAGPTGLSLDGAGNLYIADSYNHRIRRVDSVTGTITSIVGGSVGDGNLAADAGLHSPGSLSLDRFGHLYIADRGNYRVRRVDALTGIITTVAGTGEEGLSGDGGLATQARSTCTGVFVDGFGHLYITGSNRVRRVDADTGIITTVAGAGNTGFNEGDYSGDGGPATEASLNYPSGVFVDAGGHLYVADQLNGRIRKVDAETGIITAVAGRGNDFSDPGSDTQVGDGEPATEAGLNFPSGVFVDGAGHLYIADNFNGRVRKVDAVTGIITTVAGTGEEGFSGDGGPATEARLDRPSAVVVDRAGSLYIADSGNDRIRKVTASTPTAVVDQGKTRTPVAFALEQNYPNPFNPNTRIGYHLADAGPVSLMVYDMLGQRIRVLVQEPQLAGYHEVFWDGKDESGHDVAGGMYVYRLFHRQGAKARRMVRLK